MAAQSDAMDYDRSAPENVASNARSNHCEPLSHTHYPIQKHILPNGHREVGSVESIAPSADMDFPVKVEKVEDEVVTDLDGNRVSEHLCEALAGLVADKRSVDQLSKYCGALFRSTVQFTLSEKWESTDAVHRTQLHLLLIQVNTPHFASLATLFPEPWGGAAVSRQIRRYAAEAPNGEPPPPRASPPPAADPSAAAASAGGRRPSCSSPVCRDREPRILCRSRVELLCAAGCPREALALCLVYSRREGRCELCPEVDHFTAMALCFMFQTGNIKGMIDEMSSFTCHQGLEFVRNLMESRDWGEHSMLECLTQILLVRDLVGPSRYCCTLPLMRLWLAVHAQRLTDLDSMTEQTLSLATLATSSAHLYLLVDALFSQYGRLLVPLYLRLYVHAFTIDINYLEYSRQVGCDVSVLELECHMASAYMKLAHLLATEKDLAMARECVLTAFSLEPTPERMEALRRWSAVPSTYDLLPSALWMPPVAPCSGECHCREKGLCRREIAAAAPSWYRDYHPSGILDSPLVGLSSELLQDLCILVEGPRVRSLTWSLRWERLEPLCHRYLLRAGTHRPDESSRGASIEARLERIKQKRLSLDGMPDRVVGVLSSDPLAAVDEDEDSAPRRPPRAAWADSPELYESPSATMSSGSPPVGILPGLQEGLSPGSAQTPVSVNECPVELHLSSPTAGTDALTRAIEDMLPPELVGEFASCLDQTAEVPTAVANSNKMPVGFKGVPVTGTKHATSPLPLDQLLDHWNHRLAARSSERPLSADDLYAHVCTELESQGAGAKSTSAKIVRTAVQSCHAPPSCAGVPPPSAGARQIGNVHGDHPASGVGGGANYSGRQMAVGSTNGTAETLRHGKSYGNWAPSSGRPPNDEGDDGHRSRMSDEDKLCIEALSELSSGARFHEGVSPPLPKPRGASSENLTSRPPTTTTLTTTTTTATVVQQSPNPASVYLSLAMLDHQYVTSWMMDPPDPRNTTTTTGIVPAVNGHANGSSYAVAESPIPVCDELALQPQKLMLRHKTGLQVATATPSGTSLVTLPASGSPVAGGPVHYLIRTAPLKGRIARPNSVANTTNVCATAGLGGPQPAEWGVNGQATTNNSRICDVKSPSPPMPPLVAINGTVPVGNGVIRTVYVARASTSAISPTNLGSPRKSLVESQWLASIGKGTDNLTTSSIGRSIMASTIVAGRPSSAVVVVTPRSSSSANATVPESGLPSVPECCPTPDGELPVSVLTFATSKSRSPSSGQANTKGWIAKRNAHGVMGYSKKTSDTRSTFGSVSNSPLPPRASSSVSSTASSISLSPTGDLSSSSPATLSEVTSVVAAAAPGSPNIPGNLPTTGPLSSSTATATTTTTNITGSITTTSTTNSATSLLRPITSNQSRMAPRQLANSSEMSFQSNQLRLGAPQGNIVAAGPRLAAPLERTSLVQPPRQQMTPSAGSGLSVNTVCHMFASYLGKRPAPLEGNSNATPAPPPPVRKKVTTAKRDMANRHKCHQCTRTYATESNLRSHLLKGHETTITTGWSHPSTNSLGSVRATQRPPPVNGAASTTATTSTLVVRPTPCGSLPTTQSSTFSGTAGSKRGLDETEAKILREVFGPDALLPTSVPYRAAPPLKHPAPTGAHTMKTQPAALSSVRTVGGTSNSQVGIPAVRPRCGTSVPAVQIGEPTPVQHYTSAPTQTAKSLQIGKPSSADHTAALPPLAMRQSAVSKPSPVHTGTMCHPTADNIQSPVVSASAALANNASTSQPDPAPAASQYILVRMAPGAGPPRIASAVPVSDVLSDGSAVAVRSEVSLVGAAGQRETAISGVARTELGVSVAAPGVTGFRETVLTSVGRTETALDVVGEGETSTNMAREETTQTIVDRLESSPVSLLTLPPSTLAIINKSACVERNDNVAVSEALVRASAGVSVVTVAAPARTKGAPPRTSTRSGQKRGCGCCDDSSGDATSHPANHGKCANRKAVVARPTTKRLPAKRPRMEAVTAAAI